ncbi:hypothetical protein [Dysgonomonas sp. 216]|uniref:hypothetical protein n=1 Tax=Dysgonomonas sp. 216 TaxID=2302934 RepID=UPI0013CF6866|nr:hypothetical protein [Dysgonomonas sp. 216]
MEDIIFYIVVIISIVASIINNFREQGKKNAKRDISKPVQEPQSTPLPEQQTYNTPQKQEVADKKKKVATAVVNKEDSIIEEALKRANAQYSTLESINNTESSVSEEEYKAYKDHSESDNEISDNHNTKHKQLSDLFKTSDDLKKAIIYNAILDRKY